MKSKVTIEIDHHIAVDMDQRLRPILVAVLNQMYATNSYNIEIERFE
jgi:hypothetical protein